jgi:hypothetical protein
MFILFRDNVDEQGVVFDKWNEKPSEDVLIELFNSYYEPIKSAELAKEILNDGECVADSYDSLVFRLEEV